MSEYDAETGGAKPNIGRRLLVAAGTVLFATVLVGCSSSHDEYYSPVLAPDASVKIIDAATAGSAPQESAAPTGFSEMTDLAPPDTSQIIPHTSETSATTATTVSVEHTQAPKVTPNTRPTTTVKPTTTAAPATDPKPVPNNEVFILGDSLTREMVNNGGLEAYAAQKGLHLILNYHGGRGLYDIACYPSTNTADCQDREMDGRLQVAANHGIIHKSCRVYIELGTNRRETSPGLASQSDGIFRDNAIALINEINQSWDAGPVLCPLNNRKIFWQDLYHTELDRTNYVRAETRNPIIATLPGVTLANWYGVAAGDPSIYNDSGPDGRGPDGIHSYAHADVMARFAIDTILSA